MLQNSLFFSSEFLFVLRIGVRDEFRSGAEVSCPNMFSHCLHENQVDLPEYYLIFPPRKWLFEKLQGAAAPSPLVPWAVRLWL